ncbi:ROK family protein [Chloroflexota bacterium]
MQQTGKQRRLALVVDLGGTKMIIAIISDKGEVISRQYHPTLADEGPQAVIERLLSGIDRLIKESKLSPSQLRAISLATAGVIDIKRGIVTESPNLPGWKNIALRSIVEEKYKLNTFLINDADAAALGEHRFGAGRGINTLILLTLGTGIGGGIIIDGKLYIGPTGSAAEIGHMVIDANGPECSCGHNGCLETLASGTAVAREAINRISQGEKSSIAEMVKGKIEAITAETVYLAAKDGDSLALEAIAKAAYYLGLGVVNLVNIFNPEMVIMGGGMANMGDLLLEPVRGMVKERAFPLLAQSVRIVTARLGNDAGVFGAAAFALEQ